MTPYIGLPGPCHCPPERLKKVIDAFPGAPIIAAHMGGYGCWSQVEEFLLGRDIYLDTSYSFFDLGPERMKEIIKGHGAKKNYFMYLQNISMLVS